MSRSDHVNKHLHGRAETYAVVYWSASQALRRFVGKRPTGRIKNKIMRALRRALAEVTE